MPRAGSDAPPALRAELRSGEVLRWHGRPRPWTLAGQSVFLLGFMAVWTGGATFGFLTFLASGSAAAFVPGFMTAIGLWMLVQTVAGMRAAWRTVYAVTDRRVIIMEQRSRARIASWTTSALNTIERLDRRDGRGDIVFSRPSERQDTFAVRGVFIDIADVREVERLIRDLTPEPT